MSFDDAVNCHSEWKKWLHGYVAHPDHSLKMEEVAGDHQSKLGRWIRGEGRQYSAYPEFARLTLEHKRLHRLAAEIVRRADLGEDVSVEFALGVGSEFGSSSSVVVLALMDMKRRHEIAARGGHGQDRPHEQGRARKQAAGLRE
jgi:hypothetical protein